MRNQILILAAGKGTRMGKTDVPKVLVELNRKPIILYLLEELEKINQLAKPVIVVGFKYNQVKTILGDGYQYAYQERQNGTGHAVMCAERSIAAEHVLVLYGDMPFIQAHSLRKLMKLHHDQRSVVSMLTATVPDFLEFPSLNFFGRIIRDSVGAIVKITEYRDATAQQRSIREVNPGIYMFQTKWLFDHIYKIQNANAQGEYYLTDMVEVAIADGQHVHSIAVSPREVVGINDAEELRRAEKIIASYQ